jgi:hypothetical protein
MIIDKHASRSTDPGEQPSATVFPGAAFCRPERPQAAAWC